MKFNHDVFKDEALMLMQKYEFVMANLKWWEQHRIHQILNELSTAIIKTTKRKERLNENKNYI